MSESFEVPGEGDADWEGPWIEGLQRHLTGSEARLFAKRAGLSPIEAARWVAAHLGPYDAQRAVEAGVGLEHALEERARIESGRGARWFGFSEQETQAWRQLGFSDREKVTPWHRLGFTAMQARQSLDAGITDPEEARRVREVEEELEAATPSGQAELDGRWGDVGIEPVEAIEWLGGDHLSQHVVRCFSPDEAVVWRQAGFDAFAAGMWSSTGLDADSAAKARDMGRSVFEVMCERDPSDVLVWGVDGGDVQIASLTDALSIRASRRWTELVMDATTWNELAALVSDGRRFDFDEMVRQEWDRFVESDDHELSDAEAAGGPPEGWLPDGDPGDLEWQWSQPRIDDPTFLELPGPIRSLGHGSGNPLTGNSITWDEEGLVRAAEVARHLGLVFVRNDVLIAGEDCDPIPDRGLTAADEFGMMCLIPTSMYPAAQLDADAGYTIAEAGSSKCLCVADAEMLSDGNPALREVIEKHLVELLGDESYGPDEVWEALVDKGLIDDDDEMPEDWEPSTEQLAHYPFSVGETFYESSGLRSLDWSRHLPSSVCSEFGKADGGFSGDYFGFDWNDRAEIERALNELGYTIDTP